MLCDTTGCGMWDIFKNNRCSQSFYVGWVMAECLTHPTNWVLDVGEVRAIGQVE